jgi:hypothetical protein
MSNNKQQIELTEEQKASFDERILHVMLDSYYKIVENYENMTTKDEVKIILETTKAGRVEDIKIMNELKKTYGGNYPFYHADIQQFMMTCIAGGIIFINVDKDFIKKNLAPYNIYGDRIKSAIMAFDLLKSVEIISSIEDGELYSGEWNSDRALHTLKLAEEK